MPAPRLSAGLRSLLRHLDGAAERLGDVHAPSLSGDFLRGALSQDACIHAIPVALLCFSGSFRLRFRRGSCTVAAGDAAVIPAATWYQWQHGARLPIGIGLGWLGQSSDCWSFGDAPAIWARLPLNPCRLLLRAAAAAHDAGTRRTVLHELLSGLAHEDLDDLRECSPAIDAMTSLVLNRIDRRLSPDDVVQASGLGRSRAYAVFSAFYGLSLRRAIELRRLELAEALLAAGHSVADTATACGWERRETFSRAWVRAHRQPPRTARPITKR